MLVARLALLRVLGGLVRRALEVGVAQAAAAAPGDDGLLADRDEVGEQLAGLVVVHGRTGRDLEDEILARLPVAARLGAAAAGRGLEVVAVLEVAQRGLTGVHAQVDRTPAPAIPAVGAAARDVRLLAEGRGPVTTIAGADPDLHAIEEHRGHSRTGSGRGRGVPRPAWCGATYR